MYRRVQYECPRRKNKDTIQVNNSMPTIERASGFSFVEDKWGNA